MELLPAMRSIADEVYIIRQDNVLCLSCTSVELLRCETPELTAPDIWPPNSPDLNLVAYYICGVMQKRVYHMTSQSSWQRLMSVVDETVDQWRKRLDASVRAQGQLL